MFSDRDRVTALAGIYQAAALAQQIARRGLADSRAMEASVYSLFQVDAESVEAVFGGTAAVATPRHIVALMQLERKLARAPDQLEIIRKGLASAKERLAHFSMLHANILAQLADLYANVISPLQPRIIVRGEALHLQNTDNQNKIRALLLAGVRAAMLWQQVGGRRRQLLFGRRRIASLALQLSRSVDEESAPG